MFNDGRHVVLEIIPGLISESSLSFQCFSGACCGCAFQLQTFDIVCANPAPSLLPSSLHPPRNQIPDPTSTLCDARICGTTERKWEHNRAARQSNSATCSHGGYMHTSGSRDVRCQCSMSRGERDIFYRVIGFATNSVDGSDPHAGFCDKHDTLTTAPRPRT